MREIKFRVWDKSEHVWINPDDFAVTGSGEFLDYKKSLDEKSCEFVPVYSDAPKDKENYVIQQFTGLKDKNGKFVFEGDILKDIEGNISVIKSEMDYNCGCCGKMYGWNILPSLWNHTCIEDDWEIIGNIMENPDLIK